MITFSAEVDTDIDPDTASQITDLEFFTQQTRAAGESLKRAWIRVATSERAPSAYVQGVQDATVEVEASEAKGVYTATVTVKNTMPGSLFVDTGHGAYRLPERIRWPSPKTKINKKGKFYLTIPFKSGEFRTLTPTSKGWVIPARAGLRIASKALEQFDEDAMSLVKSSE